MPSRWCIVPVLLVAAACTVAAEEPTLERCAQLVRDHPGELSSYLCYGVLSRAGERDGALRALESLLAIDPDNHRARLYLAGIEADLGHERAERLYREAADGFAGMNEPAGEVYARQGLFHLLKRTDRLSEAKAELDLALKVASESDDPVLPGWVWIDQAFVDKEAGEYGSALTLLRKAETVAFPDGPVTMQFRTLESLGHVYWAQGMRERALETYLRAADIVGRAGLIFFEASARYNAALLSVELSNTGKIEFDDHLRNLERALELAVKTGNRRVEAKTRLLMAGILGGERKIQEYTRALEISRSLGHRALAREVQGRMAVGLWRARPGRREEALRLVEEVIEDARVSGDLMNHTFALMIRAAMLYRSGSRDDWIDAYLDTIDHVEKIRNLQPQGTVGARLFTRWTAAYYRFSGGLLGGLSGSPDPDGDQELAFRTIERMRSRVLIDELDTAGAHPQPSPDRPDIQRRAEILDEIALIQKHLADPSLSGGERDMKLESLERLEMEEAALRGEIARADPAYAALHAPDFPRLEKIRELLAPDQAILSYQLYSYDPWMRSLAHGSSWVALITRDGSSAYQLPEQKVIEERVSVFLGLCRRRDGSEKDAAGVLFDDLLAEPLRAAGSSVNRLVIVPDGCLHRLPFATLRPDADSEPLGATHEIYRAPSVTAWMRWQEAGIEDARAPGAHSVLALADPELVATTEEDGLRTSNPWLEGLRLGQLPHARDEARRMVRAVGGKSRLLSGSEATERALKGMELGSFRILHFAVHAVVDREHPERSAVILAPGGDEEDGFLQMREIVNLDLGGKVVFLSACHSASGTILEGEGMLGLSRAFFLAGARAVVGSLWPMRDDEAAILMGELAGRLAEGQSLAGAVAGVRASQVERGTPADAWASLVVLGDGDFVPVPGGRSAGRKLIPWMLPLLGLVLLAAIGIFIYRRFHG